LRSKDSGSKARTFARRTPQKDIHVSYPPGPPHSPGPQDPQGFPSQQPPSAQPQYSIPQQPQYGYPPQQPGYPQQQLPGHPQQPGYPQQPGVMPKSFYASWGARVGAYLIDFLIVGLVPMILIAIGYIQLMSAAVHAIQACQDDSTACPATPHFALGTMLLLYGGSLLAFAGGLWLAYREGKTGCTPGKKTLGIKLVRESTGQPVGFGMAFGRRILHFIDGLPCYLGYLWPLWDEKRQTFADKIVSTVVINTR
jgi:uncharacterized RDD family membrane protein YckC